ncbi:unnamed protein product [Adineta steineri]|uniref:Uncharacterized protein n=1 Tax=Adineta steineri TaxID=433720 RepID=A0A819G5H7_9BILA|nr:unnamed protein product [Adineta steineri]CAF3878939.1 unnamed protein product [Adineta steineri]CAF4035561.1 unnamed protein product [Adineta steineri]
MCDPTGVHITRIYVNCSRQSPSPIRRTNTVPVCTSTPIINVGSSDPKQQMALLAKEILKSQRSTDTFIQKSDSPKQQMPMFNKEILKPQYSSETFILKSDSPEKHMALFNKEVPMSQNSSDISSPKSASPRKYEEFAFFSKETGQKIDFNTGDGIAKVAVINTETITKKTKKTRQTLAVVPPPQKSNRSSKSSDDGDYLVPMTNKVQSSNKNEKTNFTSYDGIQMFQFTLDDG